MDISEMPTMNRNELSVYDNNDFWLKFVKLRNYDQFLIFQNEN